MNAQSLINAATLAAVLASSLPAMAHAQPAGKDRCFGVALAGKNDCANLAGTHSCAGEARQDNDLGEWKFVAKGDACAKMGGFTKAEAQAKIEAQATAVAAAAQAAKMKASMMMKPAVK
jgi:uncharacterized membrane protein